MTALQAEAWAEMSCGPESYRRSQKFCQRNGGIGVSFVIRHSSFFILACGTLLQQALTYCAFSQTNSELTDQIPPLRPPHTEIPPGFWDKYGVWIIVAAAVALPIILLAIWLLRQKTKPAPLHPEIEAREALKPFIGKLEDGNSISHVSRIVRRYFTAAFNLPPEELTTTEFSKASLGSEPLGKDLAERVTEFLTESDHRKFAAPNKPAPPWAVPEATALIELAEQRREYLRQQEKAQQAVKHARQS
jgi:hypothetical protein